MRKGYVEIKLNGAGRPYFVLLTPEGRRILVSQSFESRLECEECIGCLKDALDEKPGETGHFQAFEATRDSRGMFLLKLFRKGGATVLLSGNGTGEEDHRITLERIRHILSDFSIRNSEI